MNHVRLRIELTLLGPVLSQSTTAGTHGYDAVMARNSSNQPYLPYSLIRGKLRQSLEQLHEVLGDDLGADPVTLFGPRNADDETNQDRGLLRFTDFVHPTPIEEPGVRTRIKMNDETGTAEERMLVSMESPFQSGQEVPFEGTVSLLLGETHSPDAIVKMLLAGFRFTPQWGAGRTFGFGRTHAVKLKEKAVTPLTQPAQSALASLDAGRCGLILRPRSPFCVGQTPKSGNVYESSSEIPGTALLGALATAWREASGLPPRQWQVQPKNGSAWPNLEAHFAELRVGHAVPARKGSGRRSRAIPLSLVAVEPLAKVTPDRLYDVIFCEEPPLLDYEGSPRPPVFQTDWKQHVVGEKANKCFGHCFPKKELRVRTAIDPQLLRAEDEKLFAYELIDPDGHEWLSYLDLSAIDETVRQRVFDELKSLVAGGLGPIGKTKMEAELEFVAPQAISSVIDSTSQPIDDKYWVITLQTPAILCTAEAMHSTNNQSLTEALHDAYSKTWSELSDNTLSLVRYFAEQTLWGGRFARNEPRDAAGRYYPFVLTQPGSTFLLEGTSEAQKHVDRWLSRGLPLVPSACVGVDPDASNAWQKCPFLPEHGYGEIVVNAPWLKRFEPKPILVDLPPRDREQS